MMRRRSTKRSRNEVEKLQQLPFDLVTEIFLRLPGKSISRFRRLSKLCDSTFRSPSFIESYRAISYSRPKLLFACQAFNKTFFFSLPQAQRSSPLTASFLKSLLVISCLYDFHRQWVLGATKEQGNVQSICNLSTGKILTLPIVRSRSSYVLKSSLGFDPIDKQLKVLCTTKTYEDYHNKVEHHVLTLGSGRKPKWRKVKCAIRHFDEIHRRDGICINGVLYYLILVCSDEQENENSPDIVCFDVRSEKFSYVKKDKELANARGNRDSTLANHKGKLAKLEADVCSDTGNITSIKLWVLQDAEKHQWFGYTYDLPPAWKAIVGAPVLRFVGITNKGEIVMSPEYRKSDPYYLVYFNPESDAINKVYFNEEDTIKKVVVKGMEAYRNCEAYMKGDAYIFLDHVEDVDLMAYI